MSEQKKPHHGYRLPAQPDSPPSHTKRKESGLGIASFVISISGFLFLIIGFFVMSGLRGGGSGVAFALALAFYVWIFGIGFLIAELVALGLGIRSLRQKEKKKTFANLGTGISAFGILIGTVILIWLVGGFYG